MKRLFCLYISAVLMLAIFAACGAAPARSAESPPPAASTAPAAAADYAPSFDAPAAESATPLPLLTPSSAGGKKMVYTVTLRLQTTSFDAGTRKLLDTVVDMGGYVESAYVNGRNLHAPELERDATYTFRIPSENLSDFLMAMEDNYTLWSLQQESQDITAKQQQTDTRLIDLREQEKRLLETIAATTDAREKLSLERQLADVQASISSLDASQVTMDDAVLYSTVTIQLYEVILQETEEEAPASFGERFSRTVSGSANGFVAFLQGFVLVLVVLIPVAVILGMFAFITILIMRLVKKLGKKTKKQNASYEAELPQYGKFEDEAPNDNGQGTQP